MKSKIFQNRLIQFSFLAGILLALFWLGSIFLDSKRPKNEANPPIKELTDIGSEITKQHPILELAQKAKPFLDDEEARLKNWKENFPFKPMRHQTLKHDPSIYDANDSSTWDGPEDPKEILHHEFHRVAVSHHGFLVGFHQNPLRYTKEFEQLYHLLGEFDRNDNAINVAQIFTHLCYYHKAARHDPDDLLTKSKPVYNEKTRDMDIVRVPVDGKTTWGDEVKSYRESIAYSVYQEREWPGKEQMPAQKAWEIADFLIEIIPSENLVKIPHMTTFAFNSGHEKSLKEGEAFLIPREGYMEDYEAYYRKQNQKYIHINRDSPEVLILGDDGQFYDKATGKPFIPGFKPIEIKPDGTPQL